MRKNCTAVERRRLDAWTTLDCHSKEGGRRERREVKSGSVLVEYMYTSMLSCNELGLPVKVLNAAL